MKNGMIEMKAEMEGLHIGITQIIWILNEMQKVV